MIDTPSQRNKEEIVTKIVRVISHYDRTKEGKEEVFEALGCMLVAEAQMLFDKEEDMAGGISRVINEYMAVARTEKDKE